MVHDIDDWTFHTFSWSRISWVPTPCSVDSYNVQVSKIPIVCHVSYDSNGQDCYRKFTYHKFEPLSFGFPDQQNSETKPLSCFDCFPPSDLTLLILPLPFHHRSVERVDLCHQWQKTHTLPLSKNMPTISPFGIDGNPFKNIWLFHCIEITTLSPPLTSMSKKKQAPSGLLQYISKVSDMWQAYSPLVLLQYSLELLEIQPTQTPPDRMDQLLVKISKRSCC